MLYGLFYEVLLSLRNSEDYVSGLVLGILIGWFFGGIIGFVWGLVLGFIESVILLIATYSSYAGASKDSCLSTSHAPRRSGNRTLIFRDVEFCGLSISYSN